jgi:hypothetical protein
MKRMGINNNADLATARANVIKDYVLSLGVDASLIQVTVEDQMIHILGEELTGTYAIYASNGQLVQNGDLAATIQTNQLKGIYFLTLMSNKGNTTKKLSIL